MKKAMQIKDTEGQIGLFGGSFHRNRTCVIKYGVVVLINCVMVLSKEGVYGRDYVIVRVANRVEGCNA